MSLRTRTKFAQIPLTETGLSGASGSDFGASFIVPAKDKVPGSITAVVAISNTVASVALTPRWVVSSDSFNTFQTVVRCNNAAVTALNGSTAFFFEGPNCLAAYPEAYISLLSSGSSNATSAAVKVASSFNWEVPFTHVHPSIRIRKNATTATTTAASGTTIAGPTLSLEEVQSGALAANVFISSKTSSWTATPVWQVSDDGSTWYSFKPMSAAANVVAITGSGTSTANTVNLAVEAPVSLGTHRYARCSLLTGGATASAANETYTISYNYVKREFN